MYVCVLNCMSCCHYGVIKHNNNNNNNNNNYCDDRGAGVSALRRACTRARTRSVYTAVSAGDAAVHVGGDRRRQSADRRAPAATRRRLRQTRGLGALLGSAAAPCPILTQVSARVLQTDVPTARPGYRLCASTPPAGRIAACRSGLSLS